MPEGQPHLQAELLDLQLYVKEQLIQRMAGMELHIPLMGGHTAVHHRHPEQRQCGQDEMLWRGGKHEKLERLVFFAPNEPCMRRSYS